VRIFAACLSVVILLLTGFAYADKGPIIWQEGVSLAQESQKAIIFHNSKEEVLILATELQSNKETEILEFIPFPTEPQVSLAKGSPFDEVAKLIRKKGLTFQLADFEGVTVKGGSSETKTMPVEIRFSEQIGLHDVIVIKINDIDHFSRWLDNFFKSRSIPMTEEKLRNVYENARNYLQRGYSYFVFDRVKVQEKPRFLEPLVYRFDSAKIYYPLKTSNLIGGAGAVELIMILPGSFSDDVWQTLIPAFGQGPNRQIMMSSSAKMYPDELSRIWDGSPALFAKTPKIYMQVISFKGEYRFRDDFVYEANNLTPYAYMHSEEKWMEDRRMDMSSLTKEEIRDLREAVCPDPLKTEVLNFSSLDLKCWSFISNDEYDVYAAVFSKARISGIPGRDVVLEANTAKEQYKGKNTDKSLDPAMVKNFNDKNNISYPLENAFYRDDTTTIRIREGRDSTNLLIQGKTYVSRAGFNKNRTMALVYVEHIAGPRSGVGYFILLEKKGGNWEVKSSQIGKMY
jgi:hypothetical protein